MGGNDEFERIKVIGKGSYGEVWLSRHRKDKKQYVLKKMNLGKASKKERKSAEQEAKLLSKLKHPNIVSYKDSFENDCGFLFIAMQFCEGGDLYARLKEQRGVPLEERQVVEWFVQIAMALQYMHERNILHRDLKTQNIFLTKSKIIKVGDLGIARVLDSAGDMATTLIGTPYYMSPELFSNKPYNHKSDVWALGCCVYEMTTLKHAFNAKDMNSLVYKILKGRMPPMPRQYSTELLNLMRSMLHQDPEKRPSVNRILRDPYIKKNIAIFLEDTKKNCRRPSTSSQASSARPSSASSSRREVSHSSSSASAAASSSSASIPEAARRPPVPVARAVEVPKPKPSNDEIDSAPRQVPVAKPRRSSVDLAQQTDLEPIREHKEVVTRKSSSSECESTQDTLVDKRTVEEVKVSKKEPAPRKKNFLKKQAANRKSDEFNGDDKKSSSTKASSSSSSKPTAEPKRPQLRKEDRNRPLPVPKAEESSGLPQRRDEIIAEDARVRAASEDSSKSSTSVSSSNADNGDNDTPRINMSARERRRQKNPTAGSLEAPSSARFKLRRVPERASSEKLTKAERDEKEDLPSKAGRVRLRARQPSLNDSTSSSDESLRANEKIGDNKEKEVKRENKEINNFISLLDTTLHMNNTADNSDDDEDKKSSRSNHRTNNNNNGSSSSNRGSGSHLQHLQQQQQQPLPPSVAAVEEPKEHPAVHKSISMPSVETLTNTSRLMDRIRMLHKDCMQGVGYKVLKQAYEILDRIDEDEVEPKLVDLLGKERFDEYAGKIWQLKFCEESLFMAS